MSCPIRVDATNVPTIIGMVSRPDSVAVLPRATCMYWLRKTAVPNIATPTATLARTARTNVRFLNRCSGMMGSTALFSTRTAATRASSDPITMTALCHETHSKLLPANVTHSSRVETPTLMSSAPQ